MHKINVLHIINSSGRGGAEILLREGFKAADKEKFNFYYLQLMDQPTDVFDDLDEMGAKTIRFTCSRYGMLTSSFKIRRLIHDLSINIVHLHLPMIGVIGRLSCLFLDVKVVYTEHNIQKYYKTLTRILNRATWRLQHHVIAISHDIYRIVSAMKSNVPRTLIVNAIKPDNFAVPDAVRKRIRLDIGCPDDYLLIGTVASLRNTTQKRIDIWLKAAVQISQIFPNTKFLIAGDGTLLSKYEHMAAELGLSDKICFTGRVSNVNEYLSALDVFMLSSAYEGFGVVIIEAFAAGKPVVGFDVPGVNSIIKHKYNGYLASFDSNAAFNLANAVKECVSENDSEIVHNAYQDVVQKYSMKSMQQKIEQLYADLMDEI